MSLRITKIKGLPIHLHFTLIVVFFLMAWTLSASVLVATTYKNRLLIVRKVKFILG